MKYISSACYMNINISWIILKSSSFHHHSSICTLCTFWERSGFSHSQNTVCCSAIICSQHFLPQDNDLDPAPASYKSKWSAVIFQKPLSSPFKNKHMLGTSCGVPCLFLHRRLAVSLGEVNHRFQRFPCLPTALLLLSCATVRVMVYTQKHFFVYFSEFLLHTMYQPTVQSQIDSFFLCLETWYRIQLCRVFIAGVKW